MIELNRQNLNQKQSQSLPGYHIILMQVSCHSLAAPTPFYHMFSVYHLGPKQCMLWIMPLYQTSIICLVTMTTIIMLDCVVCLNAKFLLHTILSHKNGKFHTNMIYLRMDRSLCFSMILTTWWMFGLCLSESSIVFREVRCATQVGISKKIDLQWHIPCICIKEIDVVKSRIAVCLIGLYENIIGTTSNWNLGSCYSYPATVVNVTGFVFSVSLFTDASLQWCHNECDGISNHWCLDCLLKRLFRRRSKKPSKLHVTGLCEGNSLVTGEFPTQRSSNVEHVSIWCQHRVWIDLHCHTLSMGICCNIIIKPMNHCNNSAIHKHLWNYACYVPLLPHVA